MKATSKKLKEWGISYEEAVYVDFNNNIMITLGMSWTNEYYIKYYSGSNKIFNIDPHNDMPSDIRLCRISLKEAKYIGNENNIILSQEQKNELISILNSPHQDYPEYKAWDWIIAFTNELHKNNEYSVEDKKKDKFIPIPENIIMPDYSKL